MHSVLVGLGDDLPCAVGGVLDDHPCTLVGDLGGDLVDDAGGVLVGDAGDDLVDDAGGDLPCTLVGDLCHSVGGIRCRIKPRPDCSFSTSIAAVKYGLHTHKYKYSQIQWDMLKIQILCKNKPQADNPKYSSLLEILAAHKYKYKYGSNIVVRGTKFISHVCGSNTYSLLPGVQLRMLFLSWAPMH